MKRSAVVAVGLLAAACPRRPVSRRPARRGRGPAQGRAGQTTRRRGVRRCRRHRGPRREQGGDRRAHAGRQRRGRGGRRGGRARRHRALLGRARPAAASSSTTTPARGKVHTIDGRETAPARDDRDRVPGERRADPVRRGGHQRPVGRRARHAWRTWDLALRQLRHALAAPGARSPRSRSPSKGFVVDQTFHDQTAANADRFEDFTSTAKLYLPGGAPPPVGSRLPQPRPRRAPTGELGKRGAGWLYERRARRGDRRHREAAAGRPRRHPQGAAGPDGAVRPARLPGARAAAHARDVPGHGRVRHGARRPRAAPRSARRSTSSRRLPQRSGLHEYLEASRAGLRRPQPYVGDTDHVRVPLQGAAVRRVRQGARLPDRRPGDGPPGRRRASPTARTAPCPAAPTAAADGRARAEGPETTHLVVADRWGNVVAYNITIESTGGNGIVVPGRGFLLNNELTDFTFGPGRRRPEPARPRQAAALARWRRRSSLADGRPVLAVGSPAARRSSPPCCRSWSTGTTSACRCRRRSPRRGPRQRNTAADPGRAGVHRRATGRR